MASSNDLGGVGRVDQPVDWQVHVDAPPGTPEQQVRRAVAAATALVWQATCRRYPGQVDVAVRPSVAARCHTLRLDRAFAYPVISIDAIRSWEDGAGVRTWDEEAWRFDPPDRLVKQDIDDWTGRGWTCQDTVRPARWHGSWWIEATIGADPPPDVLHAAGLLAREIILAVNDPEKCGLPDKVQSITRQGTTISFDRSEWAGVPLMQELSAEWPKGHGCTAGDFEVWRDPARRERWVNLPLDRVPT